MSGLAVLFTDNHLLAVAKPAGVPTVPDDSGDESLLDRAREWVRVTYAKPGEAWLGVVHRLDRPVSGVVLFARTSKAAGRLAIEVREHRLDKIYWGVGLGTPAAEAGGDAGQLEQWLLKDPRTNRVRVVSEGTHGAKHASTTWRVLVHRAGLMLYELRPRTGRSHQLRVAAATLGTPLAGDLKYGAREPLPDKSIGLHARSLAVRHPTRDEIVTFAAPLPELDLWAIARGPLSD